MEKRKFYRPDIDGLRALAIIPVLLFHAGIAGFNGGFIGVDIFFVISGYLISSIILREIQNGTFSFVHFWERRVRRIIPVMFFITAVVVTAGYFIVLFPVDFINFGQSLVAQAFFLANLYFMRKDSYFAGPNESVPLLHMWTLSIEEQFYILLPILLVAVWLLAKKVYTRVLLWVLLAVALLSFAYNIYLVEFAAGGAFSVPFISHIWGSATNIRAAFFFLPARAWEFLIGALLATGFVAVRKKYLAEVLSIIGVVAIVYAVYTFDSTTVFPGFAVLLPVLGSALIILANTHVVTAVGSLLSFPVLVWVGLISYSLYLWHWPIIVFSKSLFTEKAQDYMFFALVLTFVLSYLTYKFVETPFRTKQICPKTTHMFLFGFVAVIVLATAGLTIHFAKGFPNRASEAALAISQAAVDVNPREYECYRKNYREIFTAGKPCLLGVQNEQQIDFVLWGDSNADAAMPIIDVMAKESGQTGAFFGAGGCRPIIWGSDEEKVTDEKCSIIKKQAVAYIAEHSVPKVLLISAWGGIGLENQAKNQLGTFNTDDQNQEDFYSALQATIDLIDTESNTIYLMKKVPNHWYSIRNEFNKAARTNQPMEPITKTYESYQAANQIQNDAIDALGKEGVVEVIDPASAFCIDGVCSLALDGKILYKNGSHLNTTGAMRLRPFFVDFFAH